MKDSTRDTRGTPLTDKQEHYCRLRSQGFTKSAAAREAYDVTEKNANRHGYYVEDDQKIKERIYELKEERALAFGLDEEEQIRKYHDMYLEARNKGDLKIALMCMERIDKLGGFEVSRSEKIIKDSRKRTTESVKPEDISKDLSKFSGVLDKHYEEDSSDDTESVH